MSSGIVERLSFSPVSTQMKMGSPPLLVNPPACYNRWSESREHFLPKGKGSVWHSKTKLNAATWKLRKNWPRPCLLPGAKPSQAILIPQLFTGSI